MEAVKRAARTKGQSPPPQPSEVGVGVLERERSSNESDLFMTVREGIVIVVNGSVGQQRGSASDGYAGGGGIELASCSSPRD